MSTSAPRPSDKWKDKKEICPPLSEIITALQDKGKVQKKKKNKKKGVFVDYYSYPLIEKNKFSEDGKVQKGKVRDGGWLKNTWQDYVRPKYKKALDRWNKLKGGRDGSPSSFINYCGTDTWLAWVFVLDLEANFLLAQNAGMPNHLQLESGFGDNMSSYGSSSGACGYTPSSAVEVELQTEMMKNKEQQEQITAAIGVVTRMESPYYSKRNIYSAVVHKLIQYTLYKLLLYSVCGLSNQACRYGRRCGLKI